MFALNFIKDVNVYNIDMKNLETIKDSESGQGSAKPLKYTDNVYIEENQDNCEDEQNPEIGYPVVDEI